MYVKSVGSKRLHFGKGNRSSYRQRHLTEKQIDGAYDIRGEEFLVPRRFLRGKARSYLSSNSTSKENGPIPNTIIGAHGDDSGLFVA
ncbi:hypothetical protein NPIL_159081 [Nephila pilipes]|uniref:Uncharacterized protein n=1 Tax=Nephila pilipes TaxID=299642 RepID=A0A8X6NH90_NEPPI|nr:hypothetical protein NPIL_159081 [Nephila pilipes]